MKPVIALIGRPNVGKSTLFNQITKSRDALVADFAGLTRDRKYGDATYQNKSFIVVDTGGIGENSIVDRAGILDNLEFMGIKLDEEKNKVRAEARVISADGYPVSIVVMPTNEELAIAQDTKKLVEA